MTLFEEALQRMEEALVAYNRKIWASDSKTRHGWKKALEHYQTKRAAVLEYVAALEDQRGQVTAGRKLRKETRP